MMVHISNKEIATISNFFVSPFFNNNYMNCQQNVS